jgi:hypothetical protein
MSRCLIFLLEHGHLVLPIALTGNFLFAASGSVPVPSRRRDNKDERHQVDQDP